MFDRSFAGFKRPLALLPDGKGPDPQELRSALGEIHPLAKTVLIEESCFLRDAASDCVLASFNAVGAFSLLVMAMAMVGPNSSHRASTTKLFVDTVGADETVAVLQ